MMATATKHKRAKRRKRPIVPPLNRQLLVRTSERASFKTCRHQWQLGYIDQLHPRQEGPALRFGSLVHKALELYYKPGIRRGPKPAETFEKLYTKQLEEAQYEFGFTDEDGIWYEAGELGVDLMEHYVEHYGRDEEWEVIASEQTFQVPVFDQGKYLFTYVGTLDGIWRNRISESVSLTDHKTTGGDPLVAIRNPGYTGPLDQQATAYWTWGVDWLIKEKIMKPRHIKELDGMLYNYLRKAVRDDRKQNPDGQYLNQDGAVSKRQPPAWFHREPVHRSEGERERTRARAIIEVKEMIRLRQADPSERFKAPHWMNCRNCGFRDICEIHEMGGDWETFRDSSMESWNPYDEHEIEMEGKR